MASIKQKKPTFTIPLPHNNRAHEHLNRPDILKRDLSLPRRLEQPKRMTELILTDGAVSVNLVTEDEERNAGEFFDGEEGVEFGFGFGETFSVGAVDHVDDSVDFGEVVFPEATCCV